MDAKKRKEYFELMDKNRDFASKVFNGMFKDPVTVEIETNEFTDDTITIAGGLYIRLVPKIFKVKSILGDMIADGYVVEKLVVKNNYPHAPDDQDVVPIGDSHRHFHEALEVAVMEYAKSQVSYVEQCLITPDDIDESEWENEGGK